jgi:hypothetical protein
MSSKDIALGQNFSTAASRLRKLILWELVRETGKDSCFRCGEKILVVDDLSIDHKIPWIDASSFFDLRNIAFSHLRCNVASTENHYHRNKESCPSGHAYTDENTYRDPGGGRHCRTCRANWKIHV